MSILSKFVTGAVLALGISFAGMSSAQAGDYGYHLPHCSYKLVTYFEYRTVPSFIYVTEYDCHGYPIEVKKLIYKTIKVPYQKYVKYCY